MSVAALISSQRAEHGVPHATACRALGVSPSWFYKWHERPPGPRQQRRADPAHRLDHPEVAAGGGERARGVFAALVGVEDDPGDAAAADGGGHPQRGHRELGVVPVAHREAEQPAGEQVLHRGQIQLALAGRDLGQIPAPLEIGFGRGEVPADQVRCPSRGLVRAGQ